MRTSAVALAALMPPLLAGCGEDREQSVGYCRFEFAKTAPASGGRELGHDTFVRVCMASRGYRFDPGSLCLPTFVYVPQCYKPTSWSNRMREKWFGN